MTTLVEFQRHFKKSRKPITQEDIKPIIDFPYPLDQFQIGSIDSILNHEHVLALAHTGAGKTTIAEFSIAECARLNKKVIYTSPIKTLSNQKFHDLRQKCSNLMNMNPEDIGLMTGDVKINPETSQCVIMTTEILRNKLYKDMSYFDDVHIVVFDEVHYIKDVERGHVWEESIIMLPKRIIIVMLSATISNPQVFANWVQTIKGVPTKMYSTDFRPVPLSFYLYSEDQLFPLVTSQKKIDYKNYDQVDRIYKKFFKDRYSYKSLFNNVCQYCLDNDMTPAILFTFSRKNCEIYSKFITLNLIEHEQIREIENIFNHYTRTKMSEADQNLPQTLLIKRNLLKGIGIHHSGLLPLLKEIVEILFGKGLIKLLFATETFAVGVNMPAKTVIFTELEKYDNYHGRRLLFTDEFLQMSGRAGRRGLDVKGNVLYMPIKNMVPKSEISGLVLGKSPSIISKFLLDARLIVKSIESSEQDTFNIISNSLLNMETQEIIRLNKQEIIQLKKQLESRCLSLTSEQKKTIHDYLELYHDQKKVKKKKLALNKIKDTWTGNPSLFEQALEQSSSIQEIENSIRVLENNNYQLLNSSSSEVYKLLNYLIDLGFLKIEDYLKNKLTCVNAQYLIRTLNKSNLTKKGLLACQINECDSLLMSMIIDDQVFQKYSVIEMITILSVFISDGSQQEDIFLEDINIPREIKDQIKSILSYHQKLDKISLKYRAHYQFSPNYQFLEYAYEWANGKSIREIYQSQDEPIYEGNFIKNMIKINNIATEIMESLAIINDFETIEKMSQISSLIVRDIVSTTSIYLS